MWLSAARSKVGATGEAEVRARIARDTMELLGGILVRTGMCGCGGFFSLGTHNIIIIEFSVERHHGSDIFE